MPYFRVVTREVHKGEWTVEAADLGEALVKVYNLDAMAEKHDDDFQYFTTPDHGGWEVHQLDG